MATCFDSIESSSGLPKNRSNVFKIYSAFWDPRMHFRSRNKSITWAPYIEVFLVTDSRIYRSQLWQSEIKDCSGIQHTIVTTLYTWDNLKFWINAVINYSLKFSPVPTCVTTTPFSTWCIFCVVSIHCINSHVRSPWYTVLSYRFREHVPFIEGLYMKHLSTTVQHAPVGNAQQHTDDSEWKNAFIITHYFYWAFFYHFPT